MKDEKKAVEWYEKAAAQGNAGAQYNLGVSYYNGQGVGKDEKKAVEWYEKAAAQSDADAQYALGVCYENGKGVVKDEKKAVEWYEKAATQGDAQAQSNLGFCYEYGHGVDKDEKKAGEWYEKAAIQGHAIAKINLGRLFYAIGLEQNLEVAKNLFVQAFEILKKSPADDFYSLRYLGLCYEYGLGTEKNMQEALECYRKISVKEGYGDALAYWYLHGKGVEMNEEEGIAIITSCCRSMRFYYSIRSIYL